MDKKCLLKLILLICLFSYKIDISYGLQCYVCTYNSYTNKDLGCGKSGSTKFVRQCDDEKDVTDLIMQDLNVSRRISSKKKRIKRTPINHFICYEIEQRAKNDAGHIIFRGCSHTDFLPALPTLLEIDIGEDEEDFDYDNIDDFHKCKQVSLKKFKTKACRCRNTINGKPCNNQIKNGGDGGGVAGNLKNPIILMNLIMIGLLGYNY